MEVLAGTNSTEQKDLNAIKPNWVNAQFSLSVVIPVYNSELILPRLIERLAQNLPKFSNKFEVILVNDGSRDQSWEVIQQLANTYNWIRGIYMMRNYGQHNALLCGIRAAKHEIIVTMDDDLQHPPEEIPVLLEQLTQGFDVVYGKPKKERHGILRDMLSIITKKSLALAMGVSDVSHISAFRVFKTNLRKAFANYQSPHLLLDVLLSWSTTRFSSVKVEHNERYTGKSNYNFRRLFNQALLILTGYSTAPLRLASFIGFMFAFLGLCILLYALGIYFLYGGIVPGFTFLASLIAIFSGAQMFALGLIGEYLGRIFNRSMERPTYVVGSTCGGNSED